MHYIVPTHTMVCFKTMPPSNQHSYFCNINPSFLVTIQSQFAYENLESHATVLLLVAVWGCRVLSFLVIPIGNPSTPS